MEAELKGFVWCLAVGWEHLWAVELKQLQPVGFVQLQFVAQAQQSLGVGHQLAQLRW